ncbi:MAG: hypothetical protein ACK559_26045, partial [bacterium]
PRLSRSCWTRCTCCPPATGWWRTRSGGCWRAGGTTRGRPSLLPATLARSLAYRPLAGLDGGSARATTREKGR